MAPTNLAQADSEYLIRRSMTKGYQMFSLFVPPVYAIWVFLGKGKGQLSANRVLRATWVGGAIGIVEGCAVGYMQSSVLSEEKIRQRRLVKAYNTASIRADDHSTIGAVLFAVLTPALLWKRGRVVHLILGGAGIGSSIGLLTHWGRTVSGDSPPRINIPSPPVQS